MPGTTPSPPGSPWLTLGCWFLIVLALSALLHLLQHLFVPGGSLVRLVWFAPALALAAMALAAPHRIRALLPDRVSGRTFGRHLLFCLVVLAGYVVLVAGLSAILGTMRPEPPVFGGLLVAYLSAVALGAFAEEIGWRGFLQPALERRLPLLLAAAVTGVAWAAWYLQIFHDPLIVAGFTLTSMAISVVYAVVSVGSWWQRGLIAGLFRAGTGVTFILVLAQDSPRNAAVPLAVFLLALVVGVGWFVRDRRRSVVAVAG